ncbi:arrestin domain-containing protein 4-like [Garra rufa]|uniref:arrestin domain-containing protein 4-like n=1 Tax=Garra rufa TaxID=137080 RepID=UPI003CCE8406
MTHIERKSLDVILDNDQRDGYCSGEVVSGHVSLRLSEATTVKSIKVILKGYAQVSWMHKRSCYSEERKCLYLSKTLVATTGTQDLILESGTYEMPFDLHLPQNHLVSSFSGKHGRVYYMVQAVFKRPFNESQRVCRELRIFNHIDVNVPTLISPVSQTCKKMIGCWIFTSGPISLTVSINRQGYCNGESIPVYASIENRSSRLVMPKAVLYQIQTYTAKGKTKSIKQVVASARGNVVPPDTSSRCNGNTLNIPPVSPSILNSDILRVEYLLAVIVQIPGAKNLEVQLPVVIGTSGFGMSSRSIVNMSLPYPTFALPDIAEAPPSYAEVVSEEQFEEHRTSTCQSQPDWLLDPSAFACIQQFRLQPPPAYSEVGCFYILPVTSVDHIRQRQVCLGDFETWSNDSQSNKCFCCSLLRGSFWKQGSLRAQCFAVGGLGLDERVLNSNMAGGWILDPGVSPSEPCAIASPRRPDRDLPAMVSRLDHTLALIMCFNIEEGEVNGKLHSE